jgi:hypothetical protein
VDQPRGLPSLLEGKATRRQLLSGVAAGTGALLAGPAVLRALGDDNDTEVGSHRGEAKNMRLLGQDDLQARSAYQPVIHRQSSADGSRWIAYIGHHGGKALNPLSGQVEDNGTSVVDVTDPRRPHYLAHIPGEPVNPERSGESGGAQMVRVANGEDLPHADPEKVYLLRSFGNSAHQVWDVTDPGSPETITTIVSGLTDTHKSWWEIDTGIAYLVCGDPAWRTNRMTKIYDLSNPESPRFIRDFGLAGQEPLAEVEPVPPALHGPIRRGGRVYFAYGTFRDGIIQVVDRDKLLNGDPRPTRENLLAPQIGRLDMPPFWGAHTTFPVLDVEIPDYSHDLDGKTRDFLVVPSEALQNECREVRHVVFIVDITRESKPFSVASYQVSEASGNFCERGGRFGPHATSESFTDIYYRRLVFISYFNAGVRALDIRDPFHPREAAFFIPATTENTDKRCVPVDGEDRCKIAIQTNNVEVDDRGFIYLVDRANTGLHVVELTGPAREIANFH